MPDQDDIDRVWDIVEKVGVGMLTTRFAGGLRARPVEPRLDRAAGRDPHRHRRARPQGRRDREAPDVGLVVISPSDKAYLSITGRAVVMRDAAMAKRIWHKTDDMWWSGPDDPNVRVIVLTPSLAELVGRAVELGGRGLRDGQGAPHRRQA